MSPFDRDVNALHSECLNTFGCSVNYMPSESEPEQIVGIWETSAQARGGGVERFSGRLWVVNSRLGFTPSKNDLFEVDGVTYRVMNHPPDDTDGSGGTYLYARKR